MESTLPNLANGPTNIQGGSRKTIVIKVGTSSIISPFPPYLPHLALLSTLTQTIHSLLVQGHNVVLVSSGAIGVGLRTLHGNPQMASQASHVSNSGDKRTLQRKQALAAIGQGRLIALWDQLFGMLDVPVGQVLLTRMDISDRTRYLNAQNTFAELLSMGVVPIVNENDTVSVSEIKFGDNDTLSAITANMVHADYLFLLTDVDCLYTDNPRKNPNAKPVKVVRDIQKVKNEVSTSTLGTSLGTGGMETKIIAADLATAAGVTTVILHSMNVKSIFSIIQANEDTVSEDELPICTRFIRRERRLADRKWWIAHGLHTAGAIVIDEGAYRAIRRKENGGRLLPAGVISVEGVFASHQAVKLIVRRKKRTTNQSIVVDEDTAQRETRDMMPAHVGEAAGLLGGSPFTQPTTPSIHPAMSISSSVTSLEALNMSGIISHTSSLALTEGGCGLQDSSRSSLDLLKGENVLADDWEDVKIGKGLALYNSVEIDRIKGLKSTDIAAVLGYSETPQVVDSIVFTDYERGSN